MVGLYLQKPINLSVFRFKYFDVKQEKNPLKVGTDSMLLGAFIEASGHKRALDLGSGTGVLSLMIAQKNPTILIDAIEIYEDGSQECRENFTSSPWSERLTVFQGDYFNFPFQGKYDLIFSNPPYFLNDLQSQRDEMSRAKHSDNETVNCLFKLVNSILSIEGVFWIIIPYSNYNFFKEIAVQNELYPCKLIHIHAKSSKLNKRIISCFKRNQSEIVNERDLIIRSENNDYSSEYQKITKDFHRNLIK